jgi:hypothetical protein
MIALSLLGTAILSQAAPAPKPVPAKGPVKSAGAAKAAPVPAKTSSSAVKPAAK